MESCDEEIGSKPKSTWVSIKTRLAEWIQEFEMPRAITPIDYVSFTITDTAGDLFSFADAGMPTSMGTAQCFRGHLETADIRVRMDGTAVTSSEGELLEAGDDLLLDQNMIASGSWVRDGGTSGVLKGHLYNVSANVFLGGQ